MSVISEINSRAAEIVESDIENWIVPKLIGHFSKKIRYLASYSYEVHDELARNAFTEQAKEKLKEACVCYFIKYKHWEKRDNVEPYLVTTLNRLSNNIYYQNNMAQKTTTPVCPGCKASGRKEFLHPQDGMLKCSSCFEEYERTQSKQAKAFALHSKKGVRCPDCYGFIPLSEKSQFGISCPYEDCFFFGKIENLSSMIHPVGIGSRGLASLDAEITGSKGDSTATLKDFIAEDDIPADVHVYVRERTDKELNILKSVISDQMAQIKRNNNDYTKIKKTLMYQAYLEMLEAYPEDMIAYLVHEKKSAEFPIQARIFQRFAKLVRNYLPFSLIKKDKTIDIVDVLDPELGLFEGISEYEAVVNDKNVVPNMTKEVYVGGREYKNYGSCFIGELIDIQNESGLSLVGEVTEYSFAAIQMSNKVEPGTKVKVKHYRILPHYEINSLVFLQRIRKAIVEKVHLRLNKKKREKRA